MKSKKGFNCVLAFLLVPALGEMRTELLTDLFIQSGSKTDH